MDSLAKAGDKNTEFESLALREQWERMCSGKEKFPSEAAAMAAIRLLRIEGRARKGHQLTPYLCKFGDPHWHFGH